MMQNMILVATNNPHKLSELRRILPGVDLRKPADLGLELRAAETGSTYLENALIKAEALAELASTLKPDAEPRRQGQEGGGWVILADDSGLEVDALDGRPGIYSARYGTQEGGEDLDDTGRTERLLTELADSENRRAAYHCSVVLLAGRELLAAHATWPGRIAGEITPGGTGFGYDPVFIPEDHSEPVSLMTEAAKAGESHRARATRRVAAAAAAWPAGRLAGLHR